jgi:hypothetical protein
VRGTRSDASFSIFGS